LDKLLQWIVNQVENGQLDGGVLTVVVPGGTFSGELIPTWQFVEVIGNAIQGGEHEGNGKEKKKGMDVPREPVIDSEYLHFYMPSALNLTDTSGNPIIMPVLRVRIDAVCAWTPGEPQGETERKDSGEVKD
jgi:hypothetical protein